MLIFTALKYHEILIVIMPHIVFDKKIDLLDFSKQFNLIFQEKPILIKVTNIFVDKNNQTGLLPALVISKIHQQFFIEISTSNTKTTIRLNPLTDPEKTDGVKISMSLLAAQIMDCYPDLKITKTNLSDYLGMLIKN
jgi:hypothetical protein